MPVVFGTSEDTASRISMILSLTLLNGIRNLSCKKEAICEHGPEAPSCPVGQGSFKMDCFKVEKCSMVLSSYLLEITDAVYFGLKRTETFQRVISVQFKTLHLWWYGVHKCIQYGHVLQGTMNAERYIKVLERHTVCSPPDVCISGKALCISAGQCKTTAITTAWLHSRRVRVLNWQSKSLIYWIENIWQRKYVKDDH